MVLYLISNKLEFKKKIDLSNDIFIFRKITIMFCYI